MDLTLSRWVIGKWKRRKWCRKKSGKVGEENLTSVNSYVKREHTKPDLGNFTLEEYTEKIIIYGYLVVSSVLYWQYFGYFWQDQQDLAITLLNRQPEMLSSWGYDSGYVVRLSGPLSVYSTAIMS